MNSEKLAKTVSESSEVDEVGVWTKWITPANASIHDQDDLQHVKGFIPIAHIKVDCICWTTGANHAPTSFHWLSQWRTKVQP